MDNNKTDIQIISQSDIKSQLNILGDLEITSINKPRSLDEFDINIVNLNLPSLWYNKYDSKSIIDDVADINNLGKMIKNRNKSQIIVCLPGNMDFCYDLWPEGKYHKHVELKNMLSELVRIIGPLLAGSIDFDLAYEETHTVIGSKSVEASFYFEEENPDIIDVLTRSKGSEKPTTVAIEDQSGVGKLYITTLDIMNLYKEGGLLDYLETLALIKRHETVPEWMFDIDMFDDVQQRVNIEECRREIERQNTLIAQANTQLQQNMRYKSILYSNGNELVEVIFEILEKLLDVDLSTFEDIKKEDFKVVLDDVTFIGEIKGISTNVKSTNITQLINERDDYIRELKKSGKKESVKGLLIINHQRNKAPQEREIIDDQQIDLAAVTKCLIIETPTLLNLFERFLNGKVTVEECRNRFRDDVGVFELEE